MEVSISCHSVYTLFLAATIPTSVLEILYVIIKQIYLRRGMETFCDWFNIELRSAAFCFATFDWITSSQGIIYVYTQRESTGFDGFVQNVENEQEIKVEKWMWMYCWFFYVRNCYRNLKDWLKLWDRILIPYKLILTFARVSLIYIYFKRKRE